jgi:hypothetical protein
MKDMQGKTNRACLGLIRNFLSINFQIFYTEKTGSGSAFQGYVMAVCE